MQTDNTQHNSTAVLYTLAFVILIRKKSLAVKYLLEICIQTE